MLSDGFGPENVGLIFPMIASHLKTGLSDQQNHWVQWGTQHFQTHPDVVRIGLERSTIFHGRIHYKWPFSIAMLVHQRVVPKPAQKIYLSWNSTARTERPRQVDRKNRPPPSLDIPVAWAKLKVYSIVSSLFKVIKL